jgi:hypothetical protein
MKKLENILDNLKVPQLEDDPFEHELRRKLTNRYFNNRPNYRFRSKFVTVLALLLLTFTVSTIVEPGIAVKLNNFAFNKPLEAETDTINDEELDRLMAEQLNENMKYTSIYNPELMDKLDPSDFKEDKAYLIRKYTSSTQGSVMMISEFDNKPKKNNRKISY